MDWSLMFEVAGFVVGIVGFIYGAYENRLRKRLERLTKSSVWSTFNACERVRGKFGSIKIAYEEGRMICIVPESRNTGEIHRDFDYELKIAAYLQDAAGTLTDLHERCVENVIEQYDHVDEAQIAAWHQSGRIIEPWSAKTFNRLIDRYSDKDR